MAAAEVFSWSHSPTGDPRQSLLFNSWGPTYRFVTDVNSRGQSVTTLYRVIRAGKEDRVAKLEWAPNGGLGRAILGKNTLPMADLVRPEHRNILFRTFVGPDGRQYRWRPNGGSDINLHDDHGQVIALVRAVRPMRHTLGDIYSELHFLKGNGSGTVMHPPLMDAVTVTAMLYKFCMTYQL